MACLDCDKVVLFENKCTSGHNLQWKIKRKSSSCSKCEIQETNLFYCTECPYYYICLDCSSFKFPTENCPNNHLLLPSQDNICIFCRSSFFGKSCFECKFAICSLNCYELRVKRNLKIREGVKFYLTVCGTDGIVAILDYYSKSEVLSLDSGEEATIKVICDLHHGKLAAGLSNGIIRVWDVRKASHYGDLLFHKGTIESLMKLNNEHLVSASSDKLIVLWNFIKLEKVKEFAGHGDLVSSLAKINTFSFLSGGYDGKVNIWSIKEDSPVKTINAHNAFVSSLCYLGKRIMATGGWDKKVKIWDIDLFNKPIVLEGHTGKISCIVRWNKDTLLTGSSDCSVRVWNLESGNCIFIISSLTTRITSLKQLERDYVAICGGSKDILIYDLVNQKVKGKVKTNKTWISDIEIIKSF